MRVGLLGGGKHLKLAETDSWGTVMVDDEQLERWIQDAIAIEGPEFHLEGALRLAEEVKRLALVTSMSSAAGSYIGQGKLAQSKTGASAAVVRNRFRSLRLSLEEERERRARKLSGG